MDTAGQEKYRHMSDLYYKDKEIVILTFDLTKRLTFDSICNDWIYEISNFCDPKKTRLLILGNKADSDGRVIQSYEAINRLESIERCKLVNLEKFSEYQTTTNENDVTNERFGYIYAEISAKTGENVVESLETIIRLIANERLKNKGKSKLESDFGNSLIIIDGKEVKPNETNSKKCC